VGIKIKLYIYNINVCHKKTIYLLVHDLLYWVYNKLPVSKNNHIMFQKTCCWFKFIKRIKIKCTTKSSLWNSWWRRCCCACAWTHHIMGNHQGTEMVKDNTLFLRREFRTESYSVFSSFLKNDNLINTEKKTLHFSIYLNLRVVEVTRH